MLEKGQPYSKLRQSYIIFLCAFDPFGMGLRRYTFSNRCHEQPELSLDDRAVRIFLNAKGTLGDETPDVQDFLRFIVTNTATRPFANRFAAAVQRVKADARERKNYMTLAMDLEVYFDKRSNALLAQGRAEGKAEGRDEGKAEASRDIALRLLMNGIPLEQVAMFTGLSEEEVRDLRQ